MFEKVNPCHPDKLADRIAGALVDMAYAKETNPRIAVEVLISHGVCHIIAETSVTLSGEAVAEAVHRIAGNLTVDSKKSRRTAILPITRQTVSDAVTTAFSKVSRLRTSSVLFRISHICCSHGSAVTGNTFWTESG